MPAGQDASDANCDILKFNLRERKKRKVKERHLEATGANLHMCGPSFAWDPLAYPTT